MLDITGLLNGDARLFGQHAGMIRNLAKEVEKARSENKGLRRALETKKCPVLVVVEPSGEFNVYGDWKADVEVVHIPRDCDGWRGTDRTLLEEFVASMVRQGHRDVFLPGRWLHWGGPQKCMSLAHVAKKVEDQVMLKAINDALAAMKEKRA